MRKHKWQRLCEHPREAVDKPGIDLYTVHLDEKRMAHKNGGTPEKTPEDAVNTPSTDLYTVHLGEQTYAQNGGTTRDGAKVAECGIRTHAGISPVR